MTPFMTSASGLGMPGRKTLGRVLCRMHCKRTCALGRSRTRRKALGSSELASVFARPIIFALYCAVREAHAAKPLASSIIVSSGSSPFPFTSARPYAPVRGEDDTAGPSSEMGVGIQLDVLCARDDMCRISRRMTQAKISHPRSLSV